MPNISGPEIIVILVLALIVLGPRRLPEIGRSVGRGLREFRAGLSGIADDEDHAEERGQVESRRPGDAADHPAGPRDAGP
jgi:sec-independent protein translocase protein TatA